MIAGKRKLFFFVVEDPECMTQLFHGQNVLLKTTQKSLIRQVPQKINMNQYCTSSAYALGIYGMV